MKYKLLFVVVSIFLSFIAGTFWGAKREKEAFRAELIKAIKSGTSAVVDDFIITADKQWTPKRPINRISQIVRE